MKKKNKEAQIRKTAKRAGTKLVVSRPAPKDPAAIKGLPGVGSVEDVVHLSKLSEDKALKIIPAPPKSEPDVNGEISVSDLEPGQRFKVIDQTGTVKRQESGWTEVQFDGEPTSTTISKNSSVIPINEKEIDMKAEKKSKVKAEKVVVEKAVKESKKMLKAERKENEKSSKKSDKKSSEKPVSKQGTISSAFRGFLENKKPPTHEAFLKILAKKFPDSIFGESGVTVESIKLPGRINFYRSRLGLK